MNRDAATAAGQFIRTFLCWSLFPVALIGLFNLLVDPLHLLPFDGVVGLNAVKPTLRDRERLFKPYAVARLRPEAVILGSSRSNHALDPNHPALHGLRAYNFSVSGTNIRETRVLFEDAVATGAVKLAVIELDMGFFEDVNFEGNNTADDKAQSTIAYLSTPGHINRVGPLLTLLRTALAWNTLPLSIGTLSGQHEQAEYTGLGQQTDRVFRWRIASYGGVRKTFEGYMQRLAPQEKQQATAWASAGVTADRFPGMEEFRKIVQLATKENIALVLFISPTHAIDSEAEQATYGWNRLEDWKRALVRTIEAERGRAEADRALDRFHVQLWDFSGYNSVTTEAVPELADGRTMMRYYWDQSHYQQLVGNWVLDRLFGLQTADVPLPADFGIELTPENMEQHFSQTRAAAEVYRLSHPSEAAFVRRLTSTDASAGF